MFKFDTHVHTKEVSKCGKVPASELAAMYREKGYSGLVITDHYYRRYFDNLGDMSWDSKIDAYLAGYKKASYYGKNIDFNVLLGLELQFTEEKNEYLIYGIDEDFLRSNKELYNMDIESFHTLVKDKDILIYHAHPYRSVLNRISSSFIDGVEVYNGNIKHNSHNDKAFRFAKEHNLKMISGSDFHRTEDLGRGGIIISENVSTVKDFINILKTDKIKSLIQTEN
jgi:histidinol phosphatase-like PHP family hydrolase